MAPKRTCGPWRRVSRTVDSLIRVYSYCYHNHHHHHLPRYRQSTQRHLRCRPLTLLYRVSRYLYLYLSLSRGCSRRYTLTTRSESVRAHEEGRKQKKELSFVVVVRSHLLRSRSLAASRTARTTTCDAPCRVRSAHAALVALAAHSHIRKLVALLPPLLST